VGTQIVGYNDLAGYPIDDQKLVQQLYGHGAVDNLPRLRDWIPVPGELHPIIGVERAVERKIDGGRYRLNHR